MKNDKSLFIRKKAILGQWVAIMDHERHDRNLQLLPCRTRCLKEKEIHEFLLLSRDENDLLSFNDVAYLGFGEINSGGVVEIGDAMYYEKQLIGNIVGFDETHFPNHYNIILRGDFFASGASQKFALGGSFSISKK